MVVSADLKAVSSELHLRNSTVCPNGHHQRGVSRAHRSGRVSGQRFQKNGGQVDLDLVDSQEGPAPDVTEVSMEQVIGEEMDAYQRKA